MKVWISTILLCLAGNAAAMSWEDLWYRPDQQGARSLNSGKPGLAAEQFKNPTWKAVAEYRSGKYQKAVETLENVHTNMGHYNRGNALAQLGQYENAIAAYNQALKLNPNDKDAKHNRDLIKQLLKQQQKHQNKKQQKQQSHQGHNQNKPGDNQKNKDSDKNDQAQNKQGQDKSGGQDKSRDSNGKQHKADNQQHQDPNNDNNGSGKGEQQPQDHAGRDTKDPADKDNGASPQKSNQQKKTGVKQDDGAKQQTESRKEREHVAERQADKQWLRQIPDDPGGLLKRKFRRDYNRMSTNGSEQTW